MAAVSDINDLLNSMEPQLLTETFIYCTAAALPENALERYQPKAMVVEDEGITLVISEDKLADNSDSFEIAEGEFSCISLKIHSSLNAVGLTAAISSALAELGISANMLAGFYHDHILLDKSDAEKAMRILSGFKDD